MASVAEVSGTGPAEGHSSILGRASLYLDLAGIEVCCGSICAIRMFIGRDDGVIAPVAIADIRGSALHATVGLHGRDAKLASLVARILLDPGAWEDKGSDG